LAFVSSAASIDATWQGVSVDALVAQPLPGNLGTVLTGTTALRWETARGIQGLTGQIDTRADPPADTRRPGVAGTAQLHLARETWTLRSHAVVGEALSLDGELSGRLPDATLATSALQGRISAAGDAQSLEALAARLGATTAGGRIDAGRV